MQNFRKTNLNRHRWNNWQVDETVVKNRYLTLGNW
jgi:hypothetical protein